MSVKLEQVLEDVKGLSANERALLAHCLISSLEQQHDDNVDAAWVAVADQRIAELESSQVQGVSWSHIKSQLKRNP